MCGKNSVAHYQNLEARAEAIEAELDDLRDLKYAMDDEEEAEEMYGEEIAELESELENLYADMGAIDNYWLTRDYYASVL